MSSEASKLPRWLKWTVGVLLTAVWGYATFYNATDSLSGGEGVWEVVFAVVFAAVVAVFITGTLAWFGFLAWAIVGESLLKSISRSYKERVEKEERRKREELERIRQSSNYWQLLRGRMLEAETARLFRELGYHVSATPVSGDEGIDLVLKGQEEPNAIVQCKGYSKPVGVAVVRELYGVLTASDSERAILVCPAGFTTGCFDFSQGKPIQLLDVGEILLLQQEARQDLPTETLRAWRFARLQRLAHRMNAARSYRRH